MTLSIISSITERLVSFWKYRVFKSFKYVLDYGSLRLIISFKSISFNSFIYFSTMFRSKKAATLLVVIIIPLLFRLDVISRNSEFHIFQQLVNVGNVIVCLSNNSFRVFHTYKYDNLLF